MEARMPVWGRILELALACVKDYVTERRKRGLQNTLKEHELL
jgi:hypothetical protein